jgi:hypothetical protein
MVAALTVQAPALQQCGTDPKKSVCADVTKK